MTRAHPTSTSTCSIAVRAAWCGRSSTWRAPAPPRASTTSAASCRACCRATACRGASSPTACTRFCSVMRACWCCSGPCTRAMRWPRPCWPWCAPTCATRRVNSSGVRRARCWPPSSWPRPPAGQSGARCCARACKCCGTRWSPARPWVAPGCGCRTCVATRSPCWVPAMALPATCFPCCAVRAGWTRPRCRPSPSAACRPCRPRPCAPTVPSTGRPTRCCRRGGS